MPRFEVEVLTYEEIEADDQAQAERIADERWGDDVHDVHLIDDEEDSDA